MKMRAMCMLIVGFFLIPGFSNVVSAVDKVDVVVPKDTIKIGVIVDMTGPTATLQTPAPRAIRMYFRNLNDQGGVYGRKVKAIIEDDRYTIPLHVAAFKKLVYRDKVFMFMEIGGTGQALALVSQFTKLKIPNFITSTSRIFVRPTLPYHFTNGATYEDEMEIIFNWFVNILKIKDPKIALVRPDTEHGKVGSRSANEQAKKYNVDLAADVILSPGALEAGSEVMRLRRVKPSHIILHLTPSSSAVFLKDAKKFGLKAFYVGSKYTCMESMLRLAGKAAENFHATNCFSAWYDDVPGVKAVKETTLKYEPGTEKKIRARGYMQGWAECVIVHEGLKRVGKNLTREGLIKAWEGMRDFDMRGLSSNVTFGPDKHQASEYCKIYKADVENEMFHPVSDWIKAGD